MVDSIYKWSTTAAANDAADSIINWRENQLPDTVNDSNRAMMKRIAEWREDMTGGLVTTGTQPAYLVTSQAVFDQLANGRFITVRCHATNAGGAATLNVNGLGAKAIRKFGTNGDLPIAIGDLQLGGLYQLMYSALANAGAGGWIISNPSTATGGGFGSGVSMLFMQAAAPTGWTKQTTHDNKAIRLVSGTGGGAGGAVAFTTAFASYTPAGDNSATALTIAMMPAHSHTQQGTFNSGNVSANHTHTQAGGFNSGTESADHAHYLAEPSWTVKGESWQLRPVGAAAHVASSGRTAAHVHATTISGQTGTISANHYHATTISGVTTSQGSGATHDHTFTGTARDFSVQYVDGIICNKD